MTDDDEEKKRINVTVPKSVHETAKRKLEYGGISREVREALRRVAFGEDMNQRSRLEQQLDELRDEREELRAERRKLDAKLENIEAKMDGIQNDISQLSSEEERYEAKLEGLEFDLRVDGMHLDPGHPKVDRVAAESQRDTEGVVNDLKERNPDVPDYAFEQVMHTNQSWDGVPEGDEDLPVKDRESRYR